MTYGREYTAGDYDVDVLNLTGFNDQLSSMRVESMVYVINGDGKIH